MQSARLPRGRDEREYDAQSEQAPRREQALAGLKSAVVSKGRRRETLRALEVDIYKLLLGQGEISLTCSRTIILS